MYLAGLLVPMLRSFFHTSIFCGFSLLVLLLWPNRTAVAQRTVDSGVLEIAFPDGRTLAEAEQWVVQQARIEALKNAFGMRIQSETVQAQADFDGQVEDAFTELSVEQVKGEWMEDKSIDGPHKFCRDGEFWFKVQVVGKARRNKEEKLDLEMALVRDVQGQEELETLSDGDRVRLRFQSPVDGHVMFFFIEDGVVYDLTLGNTEMATKVDGRQVYSLFSTESEWLASNAEVLSLGRIPRYSFDFYVSSKEGKESLAMVVAAFALSPFAPPSLEFDKSNRVWTMGEENFERWVKQNMNRIEFFQVERQAVRIRPKQRY